MARITINGITVDPVGEAPSLLAAGVATRDAARSDFILVQTSAPMTPADSARLGACGAKVLEYVPESTYLCRFAGTSLVRVRALAFVRWANVYMQEFKISASLLRSPRADRGAIPALAVPKSLGSPDERPVAVDVVLHAGVSVKGHVARIAAAAAVDRTSVFVGSRKVRILVRPSRLPAIAAIDGVRHIEAVATMKLHNHVAREIVRASPSIGGAGPFEGAGETIAICDTGVDDSHAAFAGRIAKLVALGRPTTGQTDDPDGHGTHVAGSVLGDADAPSLGTRVRGTAPKGKLYFQSALVAAQNELGGIPADLTSLFAPPYKFGARVHSNSWGAAASEFHGVYDSNARELDAFVETHRDFVICVAAGNDGIDGGTSDGLVDTGSVSPPATAKNCVSVGASESLRPDVTLTYGAFRRGGAPRFPAPPLVDDRVATAPHGMAAFSSRGPTFDLRIKPDLVAPGTSILSARSSLVTPPTAWGESGDPRFTFEGGTSMSTPLVAGCAAALREFLKSRGLAKPSAALVKALLINGAADMPGQYVPSECGGVPNLSEGFGRVDLAASIGADGSSLTFFDESVALSTGHSFTHPFVVPAGAGRARITLVWTDSPGEALVNDLDLAVRVGIGAERHGNVAPGATHFDRTNNVEQVEWVGVPAGSGVAVVSAFRTIRPQTYAIAIRFH